MKDRLQALLSSLSAWFGVVVLSYASLLWVHFSGLAVTRSPHWLDVYEGLSNLLIGFMSAFVFYFLVVYVPDRQKRALLRRNCLKMYRATKRDLVFEILSASVQGGRRDIQITSDLMDRLLSPIEFRKLFQGGREADEGFYAFSNYVQSNEEAFRRIVFKFRLVSRQIEYLLKMVEIRNATLFDQLRRIEEALYELDILHADYNDEKALSRLIWDVFADFSFIEGYRESRDDDLVERAIAAI